MTYNARELPLNEVCHYGGADREVTAAMAALHLPMPQKYEFSFIRLGYLLALPDYGCVLRIERNDPNYIVMPINHPLVLQPIGTVMHDSLRFELCPGVPRVGIEQHDMRFLQDAVEASGLVSEASYEDCGYLPVKTTMFPHGVPVVIDRTDVRWPHKNLSNSFAVNAMAHLPAETVQTQAAFYGPLCRAFDEFQRQNHSEEAARTFWTTMRDAKTDGTLSSDWRWHGYRKPAGAPLHKGEQLVAAGAEYSRHLRADDIHGPLLQAAPS